MRSVTGDVTPPAKKNNYNIQMRTKKMSSQHKSGSICKISWIHRREWEWKPRLNLWAIDECGGGVVIDLLGLWLIVVHLHGRTRSVHSTRCEQSSSGTWKKIYFYHCALRSRKGPVDRCCWEKKSFPHNFCTEGDVIKLIRWMVVDEYDRKVHQKWNCDILMTSTAANYAVELN